MTLTPRLGWGIKLRDRSSSNGAEIALEDCQGEEFHAIFQKVYRIIAHQFATPGIKGIKGFIFYGETGVGKTLMAKMLARKLSVPLLFVDSATIARKHYGDSEQLVAKFFEEATHNKALLLFDDVEALFLDRTKETSEGWNTGMNNVLFHQLDNMDTSRCSVLMTTNLIDFLDKALRDRLYAVQFPLPGLETLVAIAKLRCKDLKIDPAGVERTIRLTPDNFKSIRAVEMIVFEQYVTQIEIRALDQRGNVTLV
jgi:AAA+ superfamily predicted ATPase